MIRVFLRSLLFLALASVAQAQTKPAVVAPTSAAPLTEAKVIERVTASVDRSLEYLASKQKPDGSWINSTDRWYESDPNLVTCYALMALSYCDPKLDK